MTRISQQLQHDLPLVTGNITYKIMHEEKYTHSIMISVTLFNLRIEVFAST